MQDGYWSVDRIENGMVILENDERQREEVPLSQLPQGIREGDILEKKGSVFYVDQAEAVRRRKKAFDLQKKLFR